MTQAACGNGAGLVAIAPAAAGTEAVQLHGTKAAVQSAKRKKQVFPAKSFHGQSSLCAVVQQRIRRVLLSGFLYFNRRCRIRQDEIAEGGACGGEAGTGTAPENAGNRRRKVFLELWHVQQGGTMPCDVLPLALVCFFCYNKKHGFHVDDFAGNGKKE